MACAHTQRIGAHSHIRGLGLGDELEPNGNIDGIIGQLSARRAAGVLRELVVRGQISGRAALLTGQPGTGKTALAFGIAKSLGCDTPFKMISGSDVFSADRSKTECLAQFMRSCILVKVREQTEFIQGEITHLDISPEDPNFAGKICLRTTEMETTFDIGENIKRQLVIHKIREGHVIRVDKTNSSVTIIGRTHSHRDVFHASDKSIPVVECPSGELLRKSESIHTISLNDLDIVNSHDQGVLTLFSGNSGEIKPEIREEVDKRVLSWQESNRASVRSGVLFIDEVHLLDIECFSFLNRAIEQQNSPLLIMATNRGISPINGTDHESPHGVPVDLLDRTLIISTSTYDINELREIITLRADEEDIEVHPGALDLLSNIALSTTLRYSLNLVAGAHLVARKRHSESVEIIDIERVYDLFVDTVRSTQALKMYRELLVLSEIE